MNSRASKEPPLVGVGVDQADAAELDFEEQPMDGWDGRANRCVTIAIPE